MLKSLYMRTKTTVFAMITITDEFAGSGAFGYPEQGNYRKGDIVKAEMYSWVMDSTGEIVRREIHKVY